MIASMPSIRDIGKSRDGRYVYEKGGVSGVDTPPFPNRCKPGWKWIPSRRSGLAARRPALWEGGGQVPPDPPLRLT